MSVPKTNKQPHMVSPGGGHLGSRPLSRIEYEQRGRIYQLEAEVAKLREALIDQACNSAYYNGHSDGYKRHPNGGLFWEHYLTPKAKEAVARATSSLSDQTNVGVAKSCDCGGSPHGKHCTAVLREEVKFEGPFEEPDLSDTPKPAASLKRPSTMAGVRTSQEPSPSL